MISVLILLLYAYTIQGIGYDAGGGDRTSCGRPFRTGRIYKPSCDLTTFGYCSQAGELYPWRAVKRFVKDNQGLMRRMYGDQRHGHVLRTELEEDLDDDENEALSSSVDDHQMRWKPTSIRFARYQQNNDEDLNNDNNMLEDLELDDDNEDDVGDDEPRYLKDNDDVLNTKFVISEKEAAIAFKLAELKAAAHFRPSHRTQFSTQRIPTTRPQKISLSPVKSASSASSSSKNITKLIPTISKKGSPISNNYVRFESNNEIGANEHRTTTWKTTTKTDEKYSALDIITEESTLITTEDSLEHSTYTDDITTEINPQNASTSTSASTTKKIVTTTLQQENLFNLTSSSSEDAESTKNVETVAHDDDDDDTKHTDAPKTPGAMLFQDMEEDSVKLTNNNAEINFKNKKGINACPVKEEVVAPFWANNTRGEVLALLNMYPFEQYVHWEKCTSEFKQMYCRKGCRCEQQYRLHRLLAYDPNNECRGIFSDWFKFPSCCICKCYDIPLDFRVTSRSPRFEMNYPGEDEQEANNYNNA